MSRPTARPRRGDAPRQRPLGVDAIGIPGGANPAVDIDGLAQERLRGTAIASIEQQRAEARERGREVRIATRQVRTANLERLPVQPLGLLEAAAGRDHRRKLPEVLCVVRV